MCIRDSNRIVEIDKGKIYSYQANYSGYLELKTQRQEMEAASERKRQSILRVELEWIQRGARAVSYTHLDVYKRQTIYSSGFGDRFVCAFIKCVRKCTPCVYCTGAEGNDRYFSV